MVRASTRMMALLVLWILCGRSVLGDPGWAGTWSGPVNVGGKAIRIVFNLAESESGWAGTMDIPEQLLWHEPLTVQVNNDQIQIDIARLQFHFEGHLSPDGQKLTGAINQHDLILALELTRSEALAAPVRPQDPHPPYPYQERSVVCDGPGGIRLAGTLTVPASPQPAPAVLLIAGSGPHDRNETIYAHHLFWVLADYLSRNGWAVLRMDKRGCGQSTGLYATATTRDFAADASAEYRFLCTQPGIDSHRVGLLGHSEGGAIAPLVAAGDPSVAFVILFAGPGEPCADLLLKQQELIGAAEGAPASALAVQKEQNRRLYDILKRSQSPEEARRDMLKAEPLLGAAIAQVVSPWFYQFLRYDPGPALRRTRCPLLALDGSLDLQVYADDNLKGIADTLTAAHHPDFTVRKLPGLNHLFQTAKTGDVSEYGKIEETISPRVLAIVLSWLQNHVLADGGHGATASLGWAGTWSGWMQGSRHLVLRLAASNPGWTGTMELTFGGTADPPYSSDLSNVKVDGNEISFDGLGHYLGYLSSDGQRLTIKESAGGSLINANPLILDLLRSPPTLP